MRQYWQLGTSPSKGHIHRVTSAHVQTRLKNAPQASHQKGPCGTRTTHWQSNSHIRAHSPEGAADNLPAGRSSRCSCSAPPPPPSLEASSGRNAGCPHGILHKQHGGPNTPCRQYLAGVGVGGGGALLLRHCLILIACTTATSTLAKQSLACPGVPGAAGTAGGAGNGGAGNHE